MAEPRDGAAGDILAQERRLARRVERLFRLERRGAMPRRSRDLAGRLAGRRGDLVTALMRADAARRALDLPVSPELRAALEALWRETGRARDSADTRLRQLAAELRLARGDGTASGVRHSVDSRLIGTG
jgi:hypothetical protein